MTLLTNVTPADLQKLFKAGFSSEEVKTIHEEARLRSANVSAILYKSGKLLLQGKSTHTAEVAKRLRKLGVGNKVKKDVFRKETGFIIGSDETLKGDTFGGIVVAAVKADDGLRKQLEQLGVTDSKKLSDREIVPLAAKIKKIVSCEIKSLMPTDYNDYHENITSLLNKLHKECAQDLKPGKHIVDKYPGCSVGDIIEEKAESKYVEVAAASILARAAALDQFTQLSALAGFKLPKGSTHVKEALVKLKEKKLPFNQFVKVDFRNVKEFL